MNSNEIIEALKRSGYLFESETAKNLSRMGFFVEANQTIKDAITGKSRELDLIAEYYSKDNYNKERCVAKIRYIFEIKNNIYPLVLLTEYQFTPNSLFEEAFKVVQTIPKGINWDSSTDFQNSLFPLGEETTLFSQYCSFQKKKNTEEIMAIHPDELHEGLNKITQYAEEQLIFWNNSDETEKYYRNFLYLPVILLNDDLYELYIDEESNPQLKKVGVSRLIYNYHFNDEPKSSIVYIVTKNMLDFFLQEMINIEEAIQQSMIDIRKKI